MPTALITGITGQDGSYLAEFLLSKGYEVHGIVRRVGLSDQRSRLSRISHLLDRITLHTGSLESYPSIFAIVEKVRPDELYHLAAQSYVGYSFDDEFSTMSTNIDGTHYVLSSVRELAKDCRVYFAASSEMFGNAQVSPQNELTPLYPRSTYGITKLTGFHLTRHYREAYEIFTSNGILFNHESPRRGTEFVTRKVTQAVARIKLGLTDKKLQLGNMDACRDWGFAGDYVEAMWLMLQCEHPDDYVIGTGTTWTVQELVETAFEIVDLDWNDHVEINPSLFRASELHELRSDPTKAKKELGWEATIGFADLIRMMVEADLRAIRPGSQDT